jgi:NAD-dependent SIR2 family protein deacetylase
MFYTQGDYGLFQCSEPCHKDTYDNEEMVRSMVLAQGFEIAEDGTLVVPDGVTLAMSIPSELIPRCPKCGKPMNTNLRADSTFVEDEGWHIHAGYYAEFLRRHQNTGTLFLELGVGFNTPVLYSLRTTRKTLKFAGKQRVSDYLRNSSAEERRCA